MKFLYKLLCRSKHLSYFWHWLWTKKLNKKTTRGQVGGEDVLVNVGDDTEYRESWEIASIEDGIMKWTAVRAREDGTTYTATFEMKKVK